VKQSGTAGEQAYIDQSFYNSTVSFLIHRPKLSANLDKGHNWRMIEDDD
jgi:hypothetical protein